MSDPVTVSDGFADAIPLSDPEREPFAVPLTVTHAVSNSDTDPYPIAISIAGPSRPDAAAFTAGPDSSSGPAARAGASGA